MMLFFVLDEDATEMSSKPGLGYLTAAYRTQVRLFVSVSILAPFAYYILSFLVLKLSTFLPPSLCLLECGAQLQSVAQGAAVPPMASAQPQTAAHDPCTKVYTTICKGL